MEQDSREKSTAAFLTRREQLNELRRKVRSWSGAITFTLQEKLLRDVDREQAEADAAEDWLRRPDNDSYETARKNLYREWLANYLAVSARNALLRKQMDGIVRERAVAGHRRLQEAAHAQQRTAAYLGVLLIAGIVGFFFLLVGAVLVGVLFALMFCPFGLWAVRRAHVQEPVEEQPWEPDEIALEEARVAVESPGDEDHERYAQVQRRQEDNPFPTVPREPNRDIPSAIRAAVYRRDGGSCRHCGSTADLQYDHIVPYSRGGSNSKANIQLLCGPCNRRKGNRYSF